MIDLSIVIVSHGHADMLPDCIGSLAAATQGLSTEIIVIDNLPGGTVAAALRGRSVRVSENPVARGFAANVNRGFGLSSGRHVLLLNPDTVHDSGAIRDLIDLFQQQPDVGLISCVLLNEDGSQQQNYRQFPTPAVLLARGLAADRWPWRPSFYRRRVMEGISSASPYRVDWVFGAFMLMRRHDFQALGGMDEGFRLYYEDVDLCHRLQGAGLKTLMHPSLRFRHLHRRESAKRPFSRQWRWHVASAIRYFAKHWFASPRPASPKPPWEIVGYESRSQADP